MAYFSGNLHLLGLNSIKLVFHLPFQACQSNTITPNPCGTRMNKAFFCIYNFQLLHRSKSGTKGPQIWSSQYWTIYFGGPMILSPKIGTSKFHGNSIIVPLTKPSSSAMSSEYISRRLSRPARSWECNMYVINTYIYIYVYTLYYTFIRYSYINIVIISSILFIDR